MTMRILGFSRFNSFALSLAISVFLIAMMITAGGQFSVLLVLFSLFFSLLLTYSGEVGLRIFRLPDLKAHTFTAFTAGFIIVSTIMMALTLGLKVRAQTAFFIAAILIATWGYIARNFSEVPVKNQGGEIIAACFMMATIALFSHVPVSAPIILEKTGLLPIWDDYFIHGETIASFGSPLALSANLELAGENPPFYHYAPFMLPAAFQALSGMSGLALSTSLLLPLGLVICVLGIYIFAAELGTQLSAAMAVAAIMFIPAYATFVRSGFFDFYWILYIAPGTGYAIGISLMICALLLKYSIEPKRRLLVLIAISLLSLIVIRVHMFLLLTPVAAAMIAIVHWKRNVCGAGTIIIR